MASDKEITFSGKGKSPKHHPFKKKIQKTDRVNSPFARRYPQGNKSTVYFQDALDGEDSIEDEESLGSTFRKSKTDLQLQSQQLLPGRKALPVYQNKDEIMSYIAQNQVTVLIGETGSGKSTQIPQFIMSCLDSNKKKKIAVTQPRRVAAISLATRVAMEYGCNVGDDVGYNVRFDNRSNDKKTKLKYLTDGMLLRELMLDKNLSQYEYIIIDEAHERTILTDLILGFLKELISPDKNGARSADLKIVVMSATLQAEKFSEFFNNAPILFVKGRTYPVENFYLTTKDSTTQTDVVESMIRSIVQINSSEPFGGDILCFLPGQEEIDKAVTILSKIAPVLKNSYLSTDVKQKVPELVPLPLYAALPPNKQLFVFNRLNPKKFQRKVVLSTNIAETSVTIPGVKYVIDSGLRKVKVWRHELGLSTLLTVPVSQASCSQRSGRAGREFPGKCYRLFKESDFKKLPPQSEPEIVRCDVANPILMLKKIGVDDILNWSWLENPGKNSIVMGLQELYTLNALDDNGKITGKGEKMALLPLAPHLSNVLLQAIDNNCIEPVLDIVSCLSVENLLLNPLPEKRDEVNEKRFSLCTNGSKYGDLIMMKELYDMYLSLSSAAEKQNWCQELCVSYRGFKNVLKIKEQLKQYVKKIQGTGASNLSMDDDNDEMSGASSKTSSLDISSVLKCFLHGFVKNTAIGMPDRSYRTTTTGEVISVHPSSLLFLNKTCPAILYTEYVFTTKGYARNVSRVELQWLQEVALTARKTK